MENTAFGNAPSSSGNSPSAYGNSTNPDGVVSKASSTVHAAVNSMSEAVDVAATKAKPAIDRVAAKAHEVVDKAAASAGPAADWLGEQGANLNATQKKLVADTCAYISANPLTSVGVALVAGFLLSRVVRS